MTADTPDILQTVLCAGAGGLTLSLFNLWVDTKKKKADRVTKDVWYWLFFIIWPLIGAGIVYVYALDGTLLKPVLAFINGLSAPTTIQSLIARGTSPPGSDPPVN